MPAPGPAPRLMDIFSEALGLTSAEDRAAYLDRVCGSDRSLRDRVEGLLGAHVEGDSFLESPAAAPSVTATSGGRIGPEEPGRAIGPYKLLEPIGEGGMGTVYLAEQTAPVRRLVALKAIKAGMDSRQVLARFEAERQALALMDHPNIARVLDAGATESGRPYFVMELVKGLPITRFCDEKRLTPRERLELFIPVCQAVQHAHQKGVIHRDLKPSNVLVALYDGKPVPKVIDFGVAKATGQTLTDKTLVTGYGSIVGTLEYMSPEQAEINQLDIDTRSDIYSLGVLLYELLAGSPPFSLEELEKAGMLEMLRVIREQEPAKPSTKLSTAEGLPTLAANRSTEPTKLAKLVRGELDWIVMKALEKDRSRRYETANGFAMDVQRYLADEPVQACPPSAGYRMRKFVRRNKGRLAVAGLVLGFLASLVGVAAWTAKDRSDRRQEAALQEAGRRAALEADIGRDLDEARSFCRAGRLREASALVDHAEALAARGGAGDDLGWRVTRARTDVDMADRLETIRLERASVKEGNFDSAGAAARYRDAFRGYGLDVTMLDADAAARRIEASAIKDQLLAALGDWLACFAHDRVRLLAVLQRADPDPWRGRFRDAFRRGDRHALEELARDPKASAQPPATVLLLGNVLAGLGRHSLAAEVLRSAQQRQPDDFWLNHELARSLDALKPPQAGAAVRYYQAALALRPDSPGVHLNMGNALDARGDAAGAIAEYRMALDLKPDLAAAHNNLGAVLHARGDRVGAGAEFRKALDLQPNNPEAHSNLGIVLDDEGDRAGAGAEYRKAFDLKPDYAEAHYNLGNCLRAQGDRAGAVAEYRKALDLKPDYAEAHCNLGVVLNSQGDVAAAAAEFRKAAAQKPDLAYAHYGLGTSLRRQGDLAGAAAEFREAVALRPDYAEAHNDLGATLHVQGDAAGAIAELRKALDLKPDLVQAHINLGAALHDQGDAAAAAEYRRIIELDPKNAVVRYKLGLALHAQGDLPGAVAEYRRAIDLRPDYAEAHNNLGVVLDAQGERAGAVAEYRKAIELRPDFAEAHDNLSNALLNQGDAAGAAAESRTAIGLQPDYAMAHLNLGNALREQGDVAGAAAEFRTAIGLQPDFAEAHCNLGLVMRREGEFQAALAELRRGHELGSKDPRWNYPSADWVRQCQRLVELDTRLPGILADKATPASADERIELAELCSAKRLHRAAARFYADAFAAEPKWADGPGAVHRYNAACAAALAGCGQGKDADPLVDEGRARLRRQALDWLRADLEAMGRLLDQGADRARSAAGVGNFLRHWQADPDLAGVRGAEALARLPEAERPAWNKLWDDTADALARAQAITAAETKSGAK